MSLAENNKAENLKNSIPLEIKKESIDEHSKLFSKIELPYNKNYPKYMFKYIEPVLHSLLENKEKLKGKIERHTFHSKELNNERPIDIYLPPNYDKNPDKKYPVLYMHDGNNLFYPEISFAGVHWQVDATIEKLVHRGLIEEVIVVGMHNTMGRHFEYTWTEMKFRDQSQGGGGSKYAKFIVNELKPFIDEKYRTSTRREDTAVMGSSLGGLISLYLGYHYPDIFSKIGVISPSLWWGYGDAFRDVNAVRSDLKIWLDMGIKEGKYNTGDNKNIHISNLRTLKHELSKRGYQEGINLGYMEDEEGMHNEASWAKRFHFPILFFFGKHN